MLRRPAADGSPKLQPASARLEWARNREVSLRGFARTARDVVTNPVVASVFLGVAFGFTNRRRPAEVAAVPQA